MGQASDEVGPGIVAAVEVSIDGRDWHPAGRADSCGRVCQWRWQLPTAFDGLPGGSVLVRAVDDSGNLSPAVRVGWATQEP